MSAPAWLAGSFAVLMIMIAVFCATRLAVSRLRGRNTERDADALHVLMGVAMAGMLEPRLTPVPVTAWRAVFAAAWFAWQATRPGRRAKAARCAHPAAHAVECAAMVYMLLPVGLHRAATEELKPRRLVPGTHRKQTARRVTSQTSTTATRRPSWRPRSTCHVPRRYLASNSRRPCAAPQGEPQRPCGR